MASSQTEKLRFSIGFFVSLAFHVLAFAAFLLVMDRSRADAMKQPEIFTVTLEGGEKIGGHAQVPKDEKKHVPPAAADVASPKAEEKAEEVVPEKVAEESTKELEAEQAEAEKLADAAAVEVAKLQEAEKKLTEKKEAEKKEAEKKKVEKKQEEEEKKQEFELQEKELAKKRKVDRDKRLAKAIKAASTRYDGESVNAGGEGIGAAKLGGKGFGGGTLAPLEMVAYINQIDQIVRNNWSWMAVTTQLQAVVRLDLAPDGKILGAKITQSSGNGAFDDSVLRAVFASDPFPPPPVNFYESQFKVMNFTFKP